MDFAPLANANEPDHRVAPVSRRMGVPAKARRVIDRRPGYWIQRFSASLAARVLADAGLDSHDEGYVVFG